ncbi:MAG: G5 domain-containing protein [Oscillospiraceae bacterium]|nr:G5 domain-containing protein [Oscillospiraceae bacterium]
MQLLAPFILKRKNKSLRVLILMLIVACMISSMAPTAQAENTYVITDGNAVLVHTTYATDPAKVLEEAGVALEENDLYTTEAGEHVSEINIQRAQQVTVFYRGQTMQVSAYTESVEDLLNRLGIASDAARVSVDAETKTYDGMELKVDYVVEANETYTLEIPFETAYCDDPTLALGEEKILVEGVPGQMLCRANVTYVNGQKETDKVYEETVEKEPVTQVVAVGTGEAVGQTNDKPLIGDGVIVLPTGEVLTYTHTDQFLATAYTHTDAGCDTITANGATVKWGVVAIDPKVVPYGTRMFIVSNDGAYIYGLSTAEDCGGGIQGHRLDLYMETYDKCVQFGVRDCTVYFLGRANWRE